MPPNAFTSLPSFTRRVHGAAAIAAPLLLLASTVAFLAAGDGINDGVLGGTIGVWAAFAMGMALVGLLRVLEPRAPRAAPLLTLLAVAGAAGGTAFSVHAIFSPVFDLGPDALLETAEGSDAVAILAFLPWGWLIPFTLVATGVLLWRARVVARWSAALLVAGGALFVMGRPARVDPLILLSDAALVAALVPLGWAMLRARERDPAAAAAQAA